MAYDRADWHYDGDYPKELPDSNGGTHIGMFLAWAINNKLISDFHLNESKQSIDNVLQRKNTGREFLEIECDGKFTDEELNEEGNAFTKYYYESNMYFDDYCDSLGNELETMYHVEDTWLNYDIISKKIQNQYENWRKLQ
jgi:hypothetical protein